MEENNKHAPAFPMYNELGNLNSEGLTKREYFAGLAMQGLIANANIKSPYVISGNDNQQYIAPKQLCTEAIDMADEILKQLS